LLIMDHSHHHTGQVDAEMDMKCSMNMLFTWKTENLCIVFRSWRISSTFTLLLSLFLIVVLCAGYEAVRELSRRYEARTARAESSPGIPIDDDDEETVVDRNGRSLRWLGGATSQRQRSFSTSEIVRAALYAVQVFYSFFIMLLFMTYNGWVMLAVAAGAFVGHLAFGLKTSSTKSVACH